MCTHAHNMLSQHDLRPYEAIRPRTVARSSAQRNQTRIGRRRVSCTFRESILLCLRSTNAAAVGLVGSALPITDGEPISGSQMQTERLHCAMGPGHSVRVGTLLRRFLLSSTKLIDGSSTPLRTCWQIFRSTAPLSTGRTPNGATEPVTRVTSIRCAKFPHSQSSMRWWSALLVRARSIQRAKAVCLPVWLHL